MRRRTILTGGGLVAVAGAAGWAAFGLGGGTDPAAPAPAASVAGVPVRRETLVRSVTADGQVGFGTPQPFGVKAAGTVTWLAPEGSTVRRGQTVARVDDQPVVLLYGVLPAYRDLAEPAEGADVVQLETNLKALGYTGFTADRRLSAATTAAIRRWQHDLGLPETGSVALARVVYAPGPVRIEQHLVRLGSPAPADIASVTGTAKMVTASVPAAEAGWAKAGVAVTIGADGAEVAGTVQAVTQPAATAESGGGPPAVTVTITVADQGKLSQDRGAVTVRYAAEQRPNVLTVPVAALLALSEGGYGVELNSGGIVAVKVGMFAGGRVEISGSGIAENVVVRVPQ
ncbi:peptidoglycan-binding protein [Hamadaea tsunoensis]|uniref:peptidoglycan-binding protein n=1 Tax=Hamadaea tsunoensis TaxID=53368 RepID=UPI000425BC9A|nr:peptidoglycan-binding protein [Hamadaea tsunoensis]